MEDIKLHVCSDECEDGKIIPAGLPCPNPICYFTCMPCSILGIYSISRVKKGKKMPSWSKEFNAVIRSMRHVISLNAKLPVKALRVLSDIKGRFPDAKHCLRWKKKLATCTLEFVWPKNETPDLHASFAKVPTTQDLLLNPAFTSMLTTLPVFLYFHGGGYCMLRTRTYRYFMHTIASNKRSVVVAVDYRRPPEVSVSASIQDCLAGYQWLLGQGCGRIWVGGDSAGGGLVLSTMNRVKALKLPWPQGLVLLSPWVDLRIDRDGRTLNVANRKVDFLSYRNITRFSMIVRAGKKGCDPEVSPLFSDFTGFPKVLLIYGDKELFYPQMESLSFKVDCTKRVYKEMPHAFLSLEFMCRNHGMPVFSEARNEILNFIN